MPIRRPANDPSSFRNHPTFNLGTLSIRSTGFAQNNGTGATNNTQQSAARRIEFRANIEF